MNERIAIVVVTYNRLSLLKECILSLQRQTRKADAILVINNNSTDGTTRWLEEQNYLQVIHQENVGGAGGFYRGVKEAFERGYEWIWVMDDDVEPENDCLENLLKYKSISGCVHPIRKYVDGEIVNGELIWDLTRNNIMFMNNISYKNGKEFWTTNNACFEGMLISRKVIEKIGFPDSRFFIVYDDLMYGFYASLYTNVIYTRFAVLKRKKMASEEKWTPFYMYYSIRNLHLIKEYKEKFFPSTSNKDINRKLYLTPLHTIIAIIKLHGYSLGQKRKLASAVLRGTRDCMRKRVGK